MDHQIDWVLNSHEPWTRYRSRIDLLDYPVANAQVLNIRQEMLEHPLISNLIQKATSWPGYAIKRHNDAKHPIYAFTTLADFGVQVNDPGMAPAIEAMLAHQSPEGMFQTYMHLYRRFTGLDGEHWTWMACDSPILYVLLAMGLGEDKRVQKALDYILGTVQVNGWRCGASRMLGNFKGPGNREAPCPIVNVLNLKAIAMVPELIESEAAKTGTEMLLRHWEQRDQIKHYMFGIGTDFRKLKYPFIWYDILHVCDVLSRFPHVHGDSRFLEMITTIEDQADEDGRYTANSMYMA